MRKKKSLIRATNRAKVFTMKTAVRNPKCLDDILTVEEAAVIRKCTPQGIRKAIAEKRLRAQKKGKEWLIYIWDFWSFNVKS